MGRMRGSMADDEGSVLIAVVGIMVVLTVLVIGAFGMASDNLFQSRRDRARAQALSVAEAGIERMMWRIKASQLSTPGIYTVEVPTMGVCTIEASLTGPTTWHLVATGETSNTPGVTRTVSTDILSMTIWDMFFANGVDPGSNGHINGNGKFYGSAYMRGDWPPANGNAQFEDGPFFVKDGDVQLSGNAQIGTESTPDLYCDGTVYPNNIVSANIYPSVPNIPLPLQTNNQLGILRGTASGESSDCIQGALGGAPVPNLDETRKTGITTGFPALAAPYTDATYAIDPKLIRTYKVIDNDISVNKSINAVYIGRDSNGNKIPSFGLPYDPDLGHSRDDFSWDATLGVLTVQGTVFIDAATVNIKDVKFAGKGVIVTSGDVHIEGAWEPYCFTLDPSRRKNESRMSDADGYPKKFLVAISSSGRVLEESPEGYGLFYAAQEWTMVNGANGLYFNGSVVSPEITFVQNSEVHCPKVMKGNVPQTMPGGGGMITAIAGWHEGRN